MSTYESRRGNSSFESNQSSGSQKNDDSTKKLTKTAAKGAATYFGGPEAGQAVEMASKTKIGDKVLNKGSEALGKVPGVKQASKALDDAGVIDAADKALDIAGGNLGKGGANAIGNGAAKKGSDVATNVNNIDGKKATSEASKKEGAKSRGSNEGNDTGSDNDKSRNPFGKEKNKDKEKDEEESGESKGKAEVPFAVKLALFSLLPLFLFVAILTAVLSIVTGSTVNYNDALGVSQATGGPTGGIQYVAESKEATEFYNRVKDISNEYARNGKQIDVINIAATYHEINYHNSKITYDNMTSDKIREIADAMFDDDSNAYSEDAFKKNLKEKILPGYLTNASSEDIDSYIDNILNYKKMYYELIGYQDISACGPAGTCNYEIKGFYIYGRGNVAKNVTYNNLKVRLMQSGVTSDYNYGGTFGLPMEGEELVEFEKYILGVAYLEIGSGAPAEAIKAQMVAARSYILARPTEMGGWRTIQQEGDAWVLQTANSTVDQVYCDPDKGCSSNNNQSGMIHSGSSYNQGFYRAALPASSNLRTLANETAGEVLVNSQGYIIRASYVDKVQNQMIALANQGYNYKQILLAIYNSSEKPYGATDIVKMNCTNSNSTCSNAVSGDYASWKQYQGPWINVPLGNSKETIRSAGCLVTAISMQVARSGLPTNIQGDFNPGTFVEYLNSHGGFDSNGALQWNVVTSAVPRFKYVDTMYVLGYSKEAKLDALANLINKGYYVLAEVKGPTGQHWVAPTSISNGSIKMMDAGSNSTDMWAQYYWGNTSRFTYYRVE